MNTPVTIFDHSEEGRKKGFYLFLGALTLTLVVQIAAALDYLPNWVGGLFYGFPILFTPVLQAKTEITRFGIFRYDNVLVGQSLKWNEVSHVEVDREHQKIILTGTKQGKKRPISIVVKCPNGELDEVLALMNKQLPASSNITLPKSDLSASVV